MPKLQRFSLLLPLTITLLVMFVTGASGAQIASVTHTFQPVVAGSSIRNAVLTRRCLQARSHWLTSEELAPRPAKFGPWRYNQAIDGCVGHYPYVGMSSETVKICVGGADAQPAANINLYEHDNNNCQICTRTQNGAGGALLCNQVFNLFGRVTDASGTPLSGVQVSTSAGHAALSDVDGVYALTNLVKGDYTLTALSAGGSFSPTARFVSAASAYNVPGLDFTALPATAPPPTTTVAFTVSGRIVDAGGGGMGGVTLTTDAGATATSAPDGRYLLVGLTAGAATITPTRPGAEFDPPARTVELTATLDNVDFTAANRFAIAGRITAHTGSGIPGAQVTCATIGATFTAQTDDAGAYRCGDLAAGLYLVSFGEQKRGWFIVPPGRDALDFSVAVTAGSLAGKVLDAQSGRPLAGADVLAVEAGVRSVSGGDGGFALLLPPGVQTLRTTAPGYVEMTLPVSVTLGVTRSLDLVLKPTPVDGFRLPYPANSEYLCLQANDQDPTHRGNWSYAFDFAVPIGQAVAAARSGRVITVVDKYTATCTENSSACRNSANYIRIRHIDGTDTLYYHLQYKSARVKPGDWVTSGQIIANSGKTGFVLGPAHLDFTRHRANGWVSISVSYLDAAENDGKPRRGKLYRSQNPPDAQAAEIAAMMEMPPQGSVSLRVAQTRTVEARLDAVGMAAEVTQMRLAESSEAIEQAEWFSATSSVEWSAPALFAQFKDAEGLVSPTLSDTLLALVYGSITPSFAISPTVCVGEPLVVENQTTPYCTQCDWRWDFGNGATSNEIEPFFDYTGAASFFGYAEAGSYTVTLTVTGFYSAQTASQTVQALPVPTAEFTLTQGAGVITATAVQTDALDWVWTLNDEVIASGVPSATLALDDSASAEQIAHLLSLTVTALNSCTASSEQLAERRTYLFLPVILQTPP